MPFEVDPHGDDAQSVVPCAFGLLVSTLALMTAHAAPEPTASEDQVTLRRRMARKIVSNLFFLQQHPDAPPPLRQVATRLHARWLPMAQIEAVAQALAMSGPAVGGSLH
jgi:hypothetical protein